jgi:hypothetical protein
MCQWTQWTAAANVTFKLLRLCGSTELLKQFVVNVRVLRCTQDVFGVVPSRRRSTFAARADPASAIASVITGTPAPVGLGEVEPEERLRVQPEQHQESVEAGGGKPPS